MAQTVQPIRLVGGDCIGRIYRVIRLIQVNVNGFRWLVRVGFGRANLVQRKPNMKDPGTTAKNGTENGATRVRRGRSLRSVIGFSATG
ncbi:hypothetical protein MTR_4g131010 [Medicago truncatula]|uniref:Uncharacterized protein n=1 Tax=Medicago truncatula TaxID=3880 RepID=G7JGR4_MEDTR|nr:hypothetical protein MTR_4g131010 [Medicago truncatula]